MARHKIVIVGGGSAGLTVAARLKRQGQADVAVIDPASAHYYQPLWTLAGGGRAPVEASAKPQSKAPELARYGTSAIPILAAQRHPPARSTHRLAEPR